LKRYNARRKLKGAVQAISSGVSLDPLCCTDIDSGEYFFFYYYYYLIYTIIRGKKVPWLTGHCFVEFCFGFFSTVKSSPAEIKLNFS
jgi:hypothetical protein